MTWDELATLLKGLAWQLDARISIVRAFEEGMEGVFLHLPSAARFSSRKGAGTLRIDVYLQAGNCSMETEYIPLAALTPEFVRERVKAALVELVGRAVETRYLKNLFERLPEPRWRDMEGAG